MFQLLVNADGGLTTAGYAVSALAVILLAAAVLFFCSKNSSHQKNDNTAACDLRSCACTCLCNFIH